MKAIFNEANKDLYLCLVVYIASTKETEYVNNAAISYNKDIFVVRKSYNRQKAQDTHVSCAFLYAYLVFLPSEKIFEFNSCI